MQIYVSRRRRFHLKNHNLTSKLCSKTGNSTVLGYKGSPFRQWKLKQWQLYVQRLESVKKAEQSEQRLPVKSSNREDRERLKFVRFAPTCTLHIYDTTPTTFSSLRLVKNLVARSIFPPFMIGNRGSVKTEWRPRIRSENFNQSMYQLKSGDCRKKSGCLSSIFTILKLKIWRVSGVIASDDS